jgi:hypothetical protein
MKHISFLGWGFLAFTLIFLAAVWAWPVTASFAISSPTPAPTVLPTPDLDVTPGQVFNFWFMLIAGGVLLALLAFGANLLSAQVLVQTIDRQDKHDRTPKDR